VASIPDAWFASPPAKPCARTAVDRASLAATYADQAPGFRRFLQGLLGES